MCGGLVNDRADGAAYGGFDEIFRVRGGVDGGLVQGGDRPPVMPHLLT
jgi:hypothetical protein